MRPPVYQFLASSIFSVSLWAQRCERLVGKKREGEGEGAAGRGENRAGKQGCGSCREIRPWRRNFAREAVYRTWPALGIRLLTLTGSSSSSEYPGRLSCRLFLPKLRAGQRCGWELLLLRSLAWKHCFLRPQCLLCRSLSHDSLQLLYSLPVGRSPPIATALIQPVALAAALSSACSQFPWLFPPAPGSGSRPLSSISPSYSRCRTTMEKHLTAPGARWLHTLRANRRSWSIILLAVCPDSALLSSTGSNLNFFHSPQTMQAPQQTPFAYSFKKHLRSH